MPNKFKPTANLTESNKILSKGNKLSGWWGEGIDGINNIIGIITIIILLCGLLYTILLYPLFLLWNIKLEGYLINPKDLWIGIFLPPLSTLIGYFIGRKHDNNS